MFATQRLSVRTLELDARFAARALVLWVVVRLIVSGFIHAAGSSALGTPGSSLIIACITTVLALIELARRREVVLLGNLGVSWPRIVSWFVGPALAGEWLLRAMLGSTA
jgi:hypothetical protein